jgi:hypothetical protein
MGVRRIFAWPGTFIALVFFLTPMGQIGSAAQLLELSNSVIPLRVGYASVLLLDKPVHTIIIGDPKITEATVQSEKTVVLTAKAAGKTDVIIFDDKNNQMFSAKIEVGAAINLVETHPRGGRQGLQEFFGFSCTPVCVRVKDDPLTVREQAAILGATNPSFIQNIEQQSNPQQTTTPPSQTTTSE